MLRTRRGKAETVTEGMRREVGEWLCRRHPGDPELQEWKWLTALGRLGDYFQGVGSQVSCPSHQVREAVLS